MEPSQQVLDAVNELETLAAAGDVQALVACSGEWLARFDRRWQLDLASGRPVEQSVADFCMMALHHCDLLRRTERIADADATALMTMLAIDISGADTGAFPSLYLTLLYEFATGMIAFADASAGDDFAAPHADVMARYALRLFLAAYRRLAPPDDNPWRSFAGSVAAAPLSSEPVVINGHSADFDRPAEVLVDILARMNALGMA